jgi:phage terminase large subunit
MDPRRFQMMYGGEFDKMEGLVYNCFDEVENVCEPFALPPGTRVVAGVDWGYSHPFVIVVRAITPAGQHYQVAEFYKTQLTIDQKIEAAKRLKSIWNIEMFYCDPANPDDIMSFNQAKLSAIGSNNSLQGIDKHYELIKTRRYKIFRGSSPHTEDEYEAYHWPEEDADVSPDKNVKEPVPVDQDNHAMDANRYATVMTWQDSRRHVARVADEPKQEDQFTRLERLKRPMRVGGNTENWG